MDLSTIRDHPIVHKIDEWWAPIWEEHRQNILKYGGGALAVLILATWLVNHRATVNANALVDLEKLEMLYSKGSFDTALVDAKSFVKNHSGTKWIGLGFFYLGNCQYHTGEYGEAEQSFKKALGHWLPSATKGFAYLAYPQILETKGEYEKAVQEYQAILKKKVCEFLRPEILTAIARCYEQASQWQKAVEAYQEATAQVKGTPWEAKVRDKVAEMEAKLMVPLSTTLHANPTAR